MRLPPGSQVGPYEIQSALGAGGMGEVYRARDSRLDRTVAIKILRDGSGDAAHKLLREARAIARLNHPNIASLYDVVQDGDLAVLIMEYVDGESLSALVSAGPTDITRVVEIGIQLTEALAYAHREGVVHRDIKPSNVLLSRDRAVKLLDLGIAQTVSASPSVMTHTATDEAALARGQGTPAYMSPEQVSGQGATAKSDIYSTGVLLYELLTGQRAFEAPDPLSLALSIVNGPTPRVAERRPEVPPSLDAIVARAMAIDPADRPGTARAFNDDLRQFLDAWRTGTVPVSQPQKRRQPVLLAAGVLLLVALAGYGYWTRGVAPSGPVNIAVLPAINASEDPAVDVLGDNLVGILVDNFAATPGLKLVSANPGQYRTPGRDAQEAARAMGDGYLIDLRLQRRDSRMTLESRLLGAKSNEPLWRDSFEGDAFSVGQHAITGLTAAIERAGLLGRTLSADQRATLERWPTADAAAFDAFLQGRALSAIMTDKANADRATARFEAAIARDPAFGLAHAGLAHARLAQYTLSGDPAVMQTITPETTRALELAPGSELVQEVVARVDQQVGRLDDAERHAREATRIAPDNDRAHQLLSYVLSLRSKHAEAVQEAETAIRLRPASGNNYYNLGYVLYQNARYADAIPPLTRATELQPGSAKNQGFLGTVYHQLGDLPKAIGHYSQAIRLSPDARAHSNLATAQYQSGQFADAARNYLAALAIDDRSPTTHRNLGDAYVRLQRPAEARAEYLKAIERADARLKVNMQDVPTLAQKAVCEAKIKQHELASHDIAAAQALLKTPSSDITFKSAVIHALAGRTESALRDLEAALKQGYPTKAAREDWDLVSLRAQAKFVELVK